MILTDFNDPPIPNDRNEAAANAQRFNGVIAQAKDKCSIEIPAGNYYTHSFGPNTGGEDLRTSSIRGAGRTSKIIHDASDPGNLPLWAGKDQSDMFDTHWRDLGFLTEHVDRPVLVMHGYSVSLENLVIQGKGNGLGAPENVGISIETGQHWMLRNVQAEFCGVGMQLLNPYHVTIHDANVEYSNHVGLEIIGTDTDWRGDTLKIDGLYSEGNNVLLNAVKARFQLLRPTGSGELNLEDCKDVYIDLSTSSRHAVNFVRCINSHVDYPTADLDLPFTDDNGLNSWKVGRLPVVQGAYSDEPNVIVVQNPSYPFDMRLNDVTGDVLYSIDWEQDRLTWNIFNVYDPKSQQFYDLKTGEWGEDGPVVPTYVSGNVNRFRMVIKNDQLRDIRPRFTWSWAQGATIKIHNSSLEQI